MRISSLPSELLIEILHRVYAGQSNGSPDLSRLWSLRQVSKGFCACVEQTFKELHIRHTHIHLVTRPEAIGYVRSKFRFSHFLGGDDTQAVFEYVQGNITGPSDGELRLLIEDWKRAMIYDLPERRPYLIQVWDIIYETDLPSLRAEFGKLQILVNWFELYKAFFKIDGRLQRLKDQWVSVALHTSQNPILPSR